MAHDLTLGPPVEVGEVKGALHHGSCNDSEFGCTRCWNAENERKGTMSPCDWCKKSDFTKVVRDFEDPVLYALCQACRNKRTQELEREYERLLDEDSWNY